jgi:uncharacterized membrane protein YidH (DUF202 family)
MIALMLLGAALILVGILIFLKPEWYWTLTTMWKSYRSEEPSEIYRFLTKISGVLFVVFGIVLIALAIQMK